MKAVILTVLVSVSIANACILKGGLDKLEVTCSIPESTKISSACCSDMQGLIDKAKNGDTEPPTPEEQQALMMDCQSFQMYVMEKQQELMTINTKSPEEASEMVINAMPGGLSCTETIVGGGESACELHASQGKFGVTCEIPKATKITSECCSIMQDDIDKYAKTDEPPSPEMQAKATKACTSFMMYGMEKSQELGPEPPTPEEQVEKVISILPDGLSCKEAFSGDMLSLYANRPILSTISLAVGFAVKDVSDTTSAMNLVLSGIAGLFAGGLFMAGALFRYSKKQRGNQEPLLSEPVVVA